MKNSLKTLFLLTLVVNSANAQSPLDGTSFQASLYNFPDSVGFVRLIDVDGSDCRTDEGPFGDDAPGDTCFIEESVLPPTTVTFNAGPQAVGSALVEPTVVPFAGLEEPIIIFNSTNEVTAPLDWSVAGDLIEVVVRSSDDTFPAGDVEDFWGFSATEIQYPNAVSDSEIGIRLDEGIGSYTGFYFWLETKDGPIVDGYEILLDTGLGVGRHPQDANREVFFPLYSRGQADEQTDTVAGGSLDWYSHGSILSEIPEIGNILTLADSTLNPEMHDSESVTGVGFAILVQAPELLSVGLVGDFDNDGALTSSDLDQLSVQVNAGTNLSDFDLNDDALVDSADRDVWVKEIASTWFGDANLDGEFNSTDFVDVFQAGLYETGGAAAWNRGDWNGDGAFDSADFVTAFQDGGYELGPRAVAAASVPEPSCFALLTMAVCGFAALRKRSR